MVVIAIIVPRPVSKNSHPFPHLRFPRPQGFTTLPTYSEIPFRNFRRSLRPCAFAPLRYAVSRYPASRISYHSSASSSSQSGQGIGFPVSSSVFSRASTTVQPSVMMACVCGASSSK